MADIYGVKILKPNYLEEATSMGAAVTGGVGAGIFKSFDVIDRFIRIESEQVPVNSNRLTYKIMMPIFEKSYYSLLGVYEDLATLG
jgi:xylulokinase